MGKRDLVVAILVMVALIAFAPTANAGVNVLLLPDGPREDPGAGVDSLVEALLDAGHAVTVGEIEKTWDGTNPPTSGFDVVVHFNGKTYDSPLPVAGQQALADFVLLGGGYVSGQWNSFEAAHGQLTDMEDLVLQLWDSSGSENYVNSSVTWTIVPEMVHPVLEAIPESFTFYAGAHDAAPLVDFEEYPSTVLMTAPAGGPAVTIRELEFGRVVSFSSAANQNSEETVQDPFIELLYLNAVSWAAEAPPAPPISELENEVRKLELPGALNAGRVKALMSKVDAAARQIERGNLKAAENQMWAFINLVEAWIRAGILTEEEGAPLLEIAYEIIAGL